MCPECKNSPLIFQKLFREGTPDLSFAAFIQAAQFLLALRWTCNVFIASDDREIYHTANEHVLCWRRTLLSWRQTRFALEMNTLVLETKALKTRVRRSATHTQLATIDFQAELIVEMIATNLRKRALSRYGVSKSI